MLELDENGFYFIGEIGINHNGDINIAKKLIDAINACNWSCAKFQKRTPEICVPQSQKNIVRKTPWGDMKYIDYKNKIEFQKKEYDEINHYCKEKNLDWSASVWDINSLNFIVKNYKVPFIKIASASINNLELLKEVAKSNIQIIMSTGMSTLKEIDEAFNIIIKNSKIDPVLMHTNSSYPTPKDEINLNLIPFLKERYKCKVGYSGHEKNLEPTVIAISLGANVIERHITLSHDMWGTDQSSSLEVHAMDLLYKRSKDVVAYLGSNKKEVTKSELAIRKKLRNE